VKTAELHALYFLNQYFSGDEIDEDERVGHVACAVGEGRLNGFSKKP